MTARNSISLLLDAAVENAVQADPQEHEHLRQDIARLREVIGSDAESTLELLLVNVGAAAQAIRNYNSRTTRTIWKQSAELRNIITMLTQARVKIAGSSAQSVGALETQCSPPRARSGRAARVRYRRANGFDSPFGGVVSDYANSAHRKRSEIH